LKSESCPFDHTENWPVLPFYELNRKHNPRKNNKPGKVNMFIQTDIEMDSSVKEIQAQLKLALM